MKTFQMLFVKLLRFVRQLSLMGTALFIVFITLSGVFIDKILLNLGQDLSMLRLSLAVNLFAALIVILAAKLLAPSDFED